MTIDSDIAIVANNGADKQAAIRRLVEAGATAIPRLFKVARTSTTPVSSRLLAGVAQRTIDADAVLSLIHI